MSEIKDLQVTAGNQETIPVTTDTPALAVICSIIDSNLNITTPLTSTLSGDGASVSIVIPVANTMKARHQGTLLQIAWDFGEGHIVNTRVNLVGVT